MMNFTVGKNSQKNTMNKNSCPNSTLRALGLRIKLTPSL